MKLNNDWKMILDKEIHQPYFKALMDFVYDDYQKNICYPQKNNIFESLNLTPYKEVKVLILGQDPYHQPNQAMGLAFSVNKGVKIPPSLKNIYKELSQDLNIKIPDTGDLTPWAKQGVLLMNAIWTVRKDQPLSHKEKGWEIFTDAIISILNKKNKPMVFVLWGSFARKKKSLITNKKHLIIENVHPSPLSAYRGFFGAKPFSKINDFLIKNQFQPINYIL
ncbi:uracil-DNA glycosylase [Mycoplasmatota bacterium]|nr:uracil-DNA glycosylase [Mycoplasmatota bacterium]